MKIDFKIPDFLQKDIDALVDAINSGGLYDCELDEVYGSINMAMAANVISISEADLLRDYYCFGGMLSYGKIN